MTPAPIHSSRPDTWTRPRWRDRARDAYHYGAIQPMQRPSLWARIFGGKI
jgi:hypothetical protein